MPAVARTELDANALEDLVSRKWDEDIVPHLVEYIRIPCKSPHFDADWAANGHIDDAVELAEKWSRDQPIPGLKIEVVRIEGRTPVLLFELAGDAPGTILMYGHLDKQPEMTGWLCDFCFAAGIAGAEGAGHSPRAHCRVD
jgi:acetylornithine deacetylase/succinyl-diaminopimelate desuccinylase-like protein